MSNQVRAGASSSEDGRLFLASARNFTGRYVAVSFTALAALPVLPPLGVLAWCVWITGAVGLDWLMAPIVKRRDDEGLPTYALVAGLFASARAPYSLIGVLLWNSGAPTAQLYAIVILCISTMYSLMQLYPRPKLLLAAISPHIAAVAFILGSVCLNELRVGQPWMVLTAVMAGTVFAHFFINTQRLLAASRAQLRKARAVAEEKGLASETATRAKSTFLAVMSHEIRTPLNGIMGMAQSLTTGDLNETQRHRVEIIRESGESLLAILNDVLDLSKIEAGKLEMEEVEFVLDEL
jgi:signal transduction histidine kinase